MASSNSTGTSKMSVPEAKDAMNKFKMEVAKEIGEIGRASCRERV